MNDDNFENERSARAYEIELELLKDDATTFFLSTAARVRKLLVGRKAENNAARRDLQRASAALRQLQTAERTRDFNAGKRENYWGEEAR